MIRPHLTVSESQFKTLKYRPEFPERFGSFEDARTFCGRFFRWTKPNFPDPKLCQNLDVMKERDAASA